MQLFFGFFGLDCIRTGATFGESLSLSLAVPEDAVDGRDSGDGRGEAGAPPRRSLWPHPYPRARSDGFCVMFGSRISQPDRGAARKRRACWNAGCQRLTTLWISTISGASE